MVDSGATVSRKRPAVQLGEHWAGGQSGRSGPGV